MPKNNNLQTVSKQISTKSSHIVIGSSVAAGLTRYVTMLKVTQSQGATNGKGSRVIFCSTLLSGTSSNPTAGSANAKIAVVIPSAIVSADPTSANMPLVVKSKQIPAMPDSENPLMTIAASKWFTAVLGSAAGTSSPVHVFGQYYDQ